MLVTLLFGVTRSDHNTVNDYFTQSRCMFTMQNVWLQRASQSAMNTMHYLTKIRFTLVLHIIHFILVDKVHFCGICIVMSGLGLDISAGCWPNLRVEAILRAFSSIWLNTSCSLELTASKDEIKVPLSSTRPFMIISRDRLSSITSVLTGSGLVWVPIGFQLRSFEVISCYFSFFWHQ